MIVGNVPNISEISGCVFDVDDTLVDNGGGSDPTLSIHSRSRLAAVHAIGAEQNIPELMTLTPLQNATAFRTASEHSIEGAAWNILKQFGIVEGDEIHRDCQLLQQIVERKHDLHPELLRQHAKEIPGASRFIRRLDAAGLNGKLAIASGAQRSEINVILGDIMDIASSFENRIVSKADFTHSKPHPESFLMAADMLNPDYSSALNTTHKITVGFEDDPRGILSAKAAGIFVCAVTSRFRIDDPGLAPADVIFDTYDELGDAMGLPTEVT